MIFMGQRRIIMKENETTTNQFKRYMEHAFCVGNNRHQEKKTDEIESSNMEIVV